jgi:MoxR-like ATPase
MAVSPPVEQYIVDIVMATRDPARYPGELESSLQTGASPRASIALHRASRASAWLAGRDHVTPEDVRSVCHAVLRHRLMLSYEALADQVSADQVIDQILQLVAVG